MSQKWLQLQTHFRRASGLTGRKFFLLFLFLLGSLVLYPFAQESGSSYIALRVLGIVVILLSVYAVSFRRSLVTFALLLAIPAVLQRFQPTRADASLFSIFNTVFSFAFDLFIVVVIFRRVFTWDQPNSETIFGALCIYLLVGFSFASMYRMVATVQPNAFYLDPRINLHTAPERFDFIYYSFGTITSLGAAGVTAVSGQARSLTVIEAIIGVLYLAVLIARLMGAYRAAPPS